MGLRAKLAATFLSLLTVAILLLTCAYLDWSLKLMAHGLVTSADRVSKETFEQVRVALSDARLKPEAALNSDQALKTALRSAVAFEDYAIYIRIVALDGTVLVSSDGGQGPVADKPPPSVTQLEDLAQSDIPVGLIKALWSGQTFELARPIDLNSEPYALIEVGVSTALLAAEVHAFVWTVAAIALCALLITAFAAVIAANFLLHPVLAITTGVEQLTAGNADVNLEVGGRDELSILAEKFNQLSRRLRSERNQWESEGGSLIDTFRAITDAVLLIDADGTLLFANSEAQERLGLSNGGLSEGRSLRLLLGPGHPLIQLVEAALTAGTAVRGLAMRLAGHDGDRTFLVSIFSLGQAREAAGLLVIMRDLQQVRELEVVIDQSSRLARLGGLLSGVAHQIRKPLNVMTLQLELLRQDAEAGRATAPRLERIRGEIRRLDGTIDALMRFMRPEQLKRQPLDLNQLLREIGPQVAQPNVAVEYQLDPGLPSITADRELLSEALKNIASNGVEAMADGGVLSMRSAYSRDGFATIAIADQGCGIAPEDLSQIFNLYFTTKNRGNGLGLSLAARAIDVHGGSIEVASEVDVGTTFTINLPTAEEGNAGLQVPK